MNRETASALLAECQKIEEAVECLIAHAKKLPTTEARELRNLIAVLVFAQQNLRAAAKQHFIELQENRSVIWLR